MKREIDGAKMIKLALKEAAKSKEPRRNTASIYKMCEYYKRPDYYNQIINRITREAEEYPELLDHISLDPERLEDILLDETGIFLLSDVLTGYFPDEDIKALFIHLRAEDKQQQGEYQILQMLHEQSKKALETLLKDTREKDVPPEQQPGKDYAIELLTDEISKRKGIYRAR